jgi:hypothetical protein
MSNPESPAPDVPSRRALLRSSAAVAGGCAASLVPSPAAALSQQEAPRDGAFDVKAFGAGGLRGQNATGAARRRASGQPSANRRRPSQELQKRAREWRSAMKSGCSPI